MEKNSDYKYTEHRSVDYPVAGVRNYETYGWKKEHISFAKFEDKGVNIKRWKHCNNVLCKESKWAHSETFFIILSIDWAFFGIWITFQRSKEFPFLEHAI